MQEQLLNHHTSNSKDDFFFMINPFFPTKSMISELNKNMHHLIMHYPSWEQTISKKIQKLENVKIPLIATNGSCEAIKVFLQNCSKRALVLVPTFDEWLITNHVTLPYNASAEEIKASIHSNKVDTVCICNPNNPTGYYRIDIEQMARDSPKTIFAIDISFLDFVSMKKQPIPLGKNIILVKSLGKNYGICGLRLGYIASEDEKIMSMMEKRLPIWNINSIAEKMVDLIQKNKVDYETSRIQIIEGTCNMYRFLKSFNHLKVYPSCANFIMVYSKKGIKCNIKNLKHKKGLGPGYYRIAYRPNFIKLGRYLTCST